MVFALKRSRLQGYLQLLGAYVAIFMFFYLFITLYWKNISSHVASKFKFQFNTSIYLISVVLGSVHTIPDNSSSWRHEKPSRIVWAAAAWGGINRSHTSNIIPEQLDARVWCTKFQSSLLNICFRLSGFQSLVLRITSATDSWNRCSHRLFAAVLVFTQTFSKSFASHFWFR